LKALYSSDALQLKSLSSRNKYSFKMTSSSGVEIEGHDNKVRKKENVARKKRKQWRPSVFISFIRVAL